jgi:CheY-like chemotaxis protein
MKVLLVDNDWRFTRQATQYLESHAHHVATEPTATAAVARAKHWQPDLVIVSDEQALDGMSAEIAAMNPRPAVLLTGSMDRFDRAWRAWQKGGDELLMKPVFRAQELHDAIVTAMENAATGVRKVADRAISA